MIDWDAVIVVLGKVQLLLKHTISFGFLVKINQFESLEGKHSIEEINFLLSFAFAKSFGAI